MSIESQIVTATAVEEVKVGDRIEVWPGVDEYTPDVVAITSIEPCQTGLKFTLDDVDCRDQPREVTVRLGQGVNIVSGV